MAIIINIIVIVKVVIVTKVIFVIEVIITNCFNKYLEDELKKDILWASLEAQKKAIDLLSNDSAAAAKLIAHYFVAEPTLKTLNRGELSREEIIKEAIETQTFSAVLTDKEVQRMHEVKKVMEERGMIVPNKLDLDKVLDLSWQKTKNLPQVEHSH